MITKSLLRKVDKLTRLAQRQQDDGPVEFVLYTYDNPPPPGVEVDFEINLLEGVNVLYGEDEDDEEL